MRAAALAAAIAFVAAPGCLRWARLEPAELEAHGKVGLACSAVTTPLVWTANTLLFPASVAALGDEPPSHDNLGYPGLAVENAAYITCATVGLPLSWLGHGATRAASALLEREEAEDRLIDRLPRLSPEEYGLLVRISGRGWPPLPVPDDPRAATPAPAGAPAAPDGLWSTRRRPRFGSAPRIDNPLAAAEWREWRDAGRPRGAPAEDAFVVNRAAAAAEPSLAFVQTYGTARRERFEQEIAARGAQVAALEADPSPSAVAAALRDPAPHLRAAALGLLARSRTPGAVAEIARALGDRAVMVRAAAVEALLPLAASESAAALARVLGDEDASLRERAALALGAIGTAEAADLLLPSLGALAPPARFRALCAVAAGTPAARDSLTRALRDPDRHTRIAAAAAIGRTAATADDPLLARALGDPDPWVSTSAFRARAAAPALPEVR